MVYVAEQTEPVRRRVALKLGMDTKHVVTRFEAERQALAMMDHPNIAKVLDAGMIKFGQHHLHYSRLTMPDGHAATMLSTRFAKQQNPEFPTGHQAIRVVPKG